MAALAAKSFPGSGAAVLGLLAVASLVPAGPVTIQNSGWHPLRALAALVPAGPAQAQSTYNGVGIQVQVSKPGIPLHDVPLFKQSYDPRSQSWKNLNLPSGVGFGSAVAGDSNPARSTRTRTFTIRNPGNQQLTVSGTITGVSASNFRIVQKPSNTVAANGGSTTFTVEFKPSVEGLRLAQLTLTTNNAFSWVNGRWHSANPFVIKLAGIGLEARTLQVSATPEDGALAVNWSESQEVLGALGGSMRWGHYRVFHRRSGGSGGWSGSSVVNGHSHRITGLTNGAAYDVRVVAYAFPDSTRATLQEIAEGTTTGTPSRTNQPPYYPGLPAGTIRYLEWGKRLIYTIPMPVDPDGDTVTESSGILLDEDGVAIPAPYFNPSTRVLSISYTYISGTTDLSSINADTKNIFVAQATDSAGNVGSVSFTVKLVIPLRFSSNPVVSGMQLARGQGFWTRLPGAHRGGGSSFPIRVSPAR